MPVLSDAEGPPASHPARSAAVEAARVPRRIFSPIARGYDRPALALSLFQYRGWHGFLLSRLDLPPGAMVLDMATGTGALAFDLLARTSATVIGGDISRAMIAEAQVRAETVGDAGRRLQLFECNAEAPPFTERSFDAVTFAYLLRYVADLPATLATLGRLLKPGGTMASLDFAVPRGIWYPAWRLYTDVVMPAGGRLFSRHWREVGSFLGPSIRSFYRRWPENRLLAAWEDAGLHDVRSQRLSLGGAIVIWGRKAMAGADRKAS